MQPIIKSLLLHRYRSFLSEQVDFDNPTFFVGQNGSGKSNLVDALAFMSEAMTTPLATVLAKRGGVTTVQYRSQRGVHAGQLGLGVVLGEFDAEIRGARYSFIVRSKPNGFEVGREQCIIDLFDGTTRQFHRTADGFESTEHGLAPIVNPASLALPIVGGDARFTAVPRALAAIRVYSINPQKLREPQDANGHVGLHADGDNTAAVLMALMKETPRDLEEISELVGAIVPGVMDVRPVPHGAKLLIQFIQKWGSLGAIKLSASDMSDGTLRALGLLAAAYQQPLPAMIAIEEPEATFHPGAMGVLLEVLQHAAARTQLVVTTHSPELLDSKSIDDHHLRVVNWEDGRSHVATLAESSREAMRQHLMGAGELLRSNALDGGPKTVAPPLFEDDP
ncbi:MAG TPA: AAA family ATPase [Pirellulales bacterium]|nr:AAA family ATPase [Pirellulales bacterium]